MRRIGLIVNPVAGLGGRTGFKGSDSKAIQEAALKAGAKPEAPLRARTALSELEKLKDEIEFICASGDMGENILRESGFKYTVVYNAGSESSAEDTVAFAKMMKAVGAEIIMFAGGDGTARDILDALESELPVIGIPAGVKIHSAVYAVNPRSAGAAARSFIEGKNTKLKDAEVMDIDEDLFRKGQVRARLYGYMKIPENKNLIQGMKTGGYSDAESVGGIAAEIISEMEPDVCYIIGPGTTTRPIMEELGLDHTLLGVDVVCNKKQIAKDVNENQLYEIIKGRRSKIVVTIIGGQGHVFGRGNQQISGRIISEVGKENIVIIATKQKLIALNGVPMVTDTGNSSLDRSLCGYYKVVVGYQQYIPYKLNVYD